jgi:glycerol kinase
MNSLYPFQGPVSVDGGLSRNPYFIQFLSEVAGHVLCLPEETEQTAAGLARMAAKAAGIDVPDPRQGRHIAAAAAPGADRVARFNAARQAVEGYASFASR